MQISQQKNEVTSQTNTYNLKIRINCVDALLAFTGYCETPIVYTSIKLSKTGVLEISNMQAITAVGHKPTEKPSTTIWAAFLKKPKIPQF